MFPIQNTFVEFRSQLQDPSEFAKRSTLPSAFAPASFPPPVPFIYRTSFSPNTPIVPLSQPQPQHRPKLQAPKTESPVVAPVLAKLPVAPQASVSVSEGSFRSEPKRKSLADRGWQAVLVHGEAFKDGTAAVRTALAAAPFGLPARCYKSAEAFLRTFEKKREPQKSILFVEASEAAGVLTWVHVRRFSHILHVVVLGPPRSGGEHAADAAAFVRDFDAAVVEAQLITASNH
jgi:hypothetical protein